MRLRKFRLDAKGLSILTDGIFQVALRAQHQPKAVVECGVVRLQADGRAVLLNRTRKVILLLEHAA